MLRSPYQLRQFGDIGGDPPRLVLGHEKLLSFTIGAGAIVFDDPGLREVAGCDPW
jgi:hypothetical protein